MANEEKFWRECEVLNNSIYLDLKELIAINPRYSSLNLELVIDEMPKSAMFKFNNKVDDLILSDFKEELKSIANSGKFLITFINNHYFEISFNSNNLAEPTIYSYYCDELETIYPVIFNPVTNKNEIIRDLNDNGTCKNAIKVFSSLKKKVLDNLMFIYLQMFEADGKNSLGYYQFMFS